MTQKNFKEGEKNSRQAAVQFSLLGLIVFSAILVAAGALAASALTGNRSRAAVAKPSGNSPNVIYDSGPGPTNLPPWGELVIRNMALEQPEEYVAFELQTNRPAQWVFKGMTLEQVRGLMGSCGISTNEIDHALSSSLARTTTGGVVIQPDDELILSLTPQVRAVLYGRLAGDDANHYMRYPFCFPGNSFDSCFDGFADKESVALIKKLLYPRGDAQCFSDYEWLLKHLATDEARLSAVKVLSRQTVVQLGLRIRSGTDIDRLVGYWGAAQGVRFKDIRPLLESTKRIQPNGGAVSVLYLLPQFARQRLYTFPMPSSNPADPAMDCHWSTMNFFNEVPDDRFTDTAYTSRYVLEHFYQVAKPGFYGDIIFVLDEKGNAIHSGVYIADNIIFTKNGNNFAQPWTLMHLKDLLARYANTESPTRLAVYRSKDR